MGQNGEMVLFGALRKIQICSTYGSSAELEFTDSPFPIKSVRSSSASLVVSIIAIIRLLPTNQPANQPPSPKKKHTHARTQGP